MTLPTKNNCIVVTLCEPEKKVHAVYWFSLTSFLLPS